MTLTIEKTSFFEKHLVPENIAEFLPVLNAVNHGAFPPDFAKLAQVSENWIWDEDPVHVNGKIKMAVANASYGEDLDSPAKIYQHTVEILRSIGYEGEILDITATSGFPWLRQVTPGLSEESYKLAQALALRELSRQAIGALGLKPEDVGLFLAATSIPTGPYFDREWLAADGIPPETPSEPYCMACNSSGKAVADLLLGKYDDILSKNNPKFAAGEPILVVLNANDDANKLADKGKGDASSGQLFSTGGAVLAFWYHPTGRSSMRLVKGVVEDENGQKETVIAHSSLSEANGTKYLKIPTPQKNWTEVEQARVHIAQHVVETEDGGPIALHPRAGVVFERYGEKVARETLAKYKQLGGQVSDIKRVIMHHPSGVIFEHIQDEFAKHGFTPDQVLWVIDEGNIPVCTMPMALGRQLDGLEPGDRLMILTYGAGGEYTCIIVELGDMTAEGNISAYVPALGALHEEEKVG